MTPTGVEVVTEKKEMCQNWKMENKTFLFPGTYKVYH